MTGPNHPETHREQARAVLARFRSGEPVGPAGDGVAWSDQARAAADEAEARMEKLAYLFPEHNDGGGPTRAGLEEASLAWGMALFASLFIRVPEDMRCPHFKRQRTMMFQVSLTARYVACDRCQPLYINRAMVRLGIASPDRQGLHRVPFVPDAPCEVCGGVPPDGMYRPFVSTAGSLVVDGNACESCYQFSQTMEGR